MLLVTSNLRDGSGLLLCLFPNIPGDEYHDLCEQSIPEAGVSSDKVIQSDPRPGADDRPHEAHIHPVTRQDRDRDKDELREPLILSRLRDRLINIPKHRYHRHEVNDTQDEPFCAGFH